MLKIIAKAEVAEHFKECVMPGSLADVFDVIGPDAFLCVGNAVAGGFLGSVKVFFQGSHAGIDPQQGGIVVGHQRSAGFNHVAFGCEIIQEHLANLISGKLFHNFLHI